MSPATARVMGLLLVCLWSLLGNKAWAEPLTEKSVSGSVIVVLGQSDGEGVDPALAKLEALHRPPFDSFPKKTLLRSLNVALPLAKQVEIELPNGRKLRLVWLATTADGRFRVNVSINRTGKQDYLPLMTVIAAPGDPFFVAGQKHLGGTLILGITVGQAAVSTKAKH